MSDQTYDVLIAGAGPVGLLLACELRLAASDISVLVLDRDVDPSNTDTPWKRAPLGTRGINTLSAESLDRRGLLDEVIGKEMLDKRSANFAELGWFPGHFAGIRIDASLVDRSNPCWKYKLPGPAFSPVPTSLERVINATYRRARELGVEILGGINVTAATQDGDGVVIHATGGKSFRGKWLVGCDGGRSKIRKSAGFEFVGTDAELLGWTVLCDIEDPNNRLQDGFTRTSTGLYLKMLPGHIGTMEPMASGGAFDRATELTAAEFQVILRRVTGCDDINIKNLYRASSYTDRAMQTSRYRKDRIFLAGDSAHIHAPLGGQGMNAGIGDAMNLGWKLAAVVQGKSSPDLLDTYEKERHPIGAWITEWTRAQVATMKPDLSSRAVANLVKEMMATRDGATIMMARFMGVLQCYDLSLGGSEQLHSIVGFSVPDFTFLKGTGRLGERLRSGRGIIIEFGDQDQLRSLSDEWSGRIDYVCEGAEDELGFRALLVRPDGIVAWATEEEPDVAAIKASLSRWF